MTNRNGHLLRDTLLEGELEATNHRFQKRPGKQWTHLSDGVLTRSQIDYVLVRRKWRSSIKNTEPCNSFNSLGSDHRAVLSTVKLSLRKSKSPPRVTLYDFGHLKTDQELQMKYGVEVRNRYSALLSEEQLDLGFTNDVTTKYGKFIEAVKYANRKHLPHKPKKRYDDPANDPRVEGARLLEENCLLPRRPTIWILVKTPDRQLPRRRTLSLHAIVLWRRSCLNRK